MGADGGLTWMALHDPKKRDRVHALIAPFGFLDDDFRSEDCAYMRAHPKDFEGVIVTRYGTDLSHDGVRELYEILAYMEDDKRTFEEIAAEIATAPDWTMYKLGTFEKAVMRACSYDAWWDYFCARRIFDSDRTAEREARRLAVAGERGLGNLKVLRPMIVNDWTAELKRHLVWERYHTVETWT